MTKQLKNLKLDNLTNEELLNMVKYLTERLSIAEGERDFIKKLANDLELESRKLCSEERSMRQKLEELGVKVN